MKRFLATLLVAVALFSAFAPTTLAAANFFGPIVPDGTNGQPNCHCEDVTSPGGVSVPSAPDWGCVMQTIQNLINLMISISLIIAILYIVLTGFLFVTSAGSPGQREAAKTRLMNVVIGMIVVLAAWLIVDFVMRTLYNGESRDFGPWNQILEADNASVCIKVAEPPDSLPGIIGAQPAGPGGDTGTPGDPGELSGDRLTHAEATALLSAAGIGLSSSGNCSTRSDGSCTSLEGVLEDAVRQVIAVKKDCDCAVTVTGGTEVGHSAGTYSHYKGYKIDLRVNAEIDAYMRSLRRSGSRGSDARYLDRCGNEYVREGSPQHWDVTVMRGVCDPPKN